MCLSTNILLDGIKINIFYNIIVAEDVLNSIQSFEYVDWYLGVVVRNRKNINVVLGIYKYRKWFFVIFDIYY